MQDATLNSISQVYAAALIAVSHLKLVFFSVCSLITELGYRHLFFKTMASLFVVKWLNKCTQAVIKYLAGRVIGKFPDEIHEILTISNVAKYGNNHWQNMEITIIIFEGEKGPNFDTRSPSKYQRPIIKLMCYAMF